jgi:hypothetical protein
MIGSQDIRAREARNWGDVDKNRENWLRLLKKARVHILLSSQ